MGSELALHRYEEIYGQISHVLAVAEDSFTATQKSSKGHYSKPSHLHLILEFFFLLVPVWRTEVKYTCDILFPHTVQIFTALVSGISVIWPG
jgi:hypothetical protein